MFERVNHTSLAVSLYYNRDARKLAKFGDMIYHSRRGRYVVLYVPDHALEETQTAISSLRFVKAVAPSHLGTIGHQFVGALEQFKVTPLIPEADFKLD